MGVDEPAHVNGVPVILLADKARNALVRVALLAIFVGEQQPRGRDDDNVALEGGRAIVRKAEETELRGRAVAKTRREDDRHSADRNRLGRRQRVIHARVVVEADGRKRPAEAVVDLRDARVLLEMNAEGDRRKVRDAEVALLDNKHARRKGLQLHRTAADVDVRRGENVVIERPDAELVIAVTQFQAAPECFRGRQRQQVLFPRGDVARGKGRQPEGRIVRRRIHEVGDGRDRAAAVALDRVERQRRRFRSRLGLVRCVNLKRNECESGKHRQLLVVVHIESVVVC